MRMLIFLDKIFQVNLYGVASAFAAEKVGLVELETITVSMNREALYQNALFISALTAAIYGTYRVGKLACDGISFITKKIKERNERRKTDRRSK